MPLLIVLFVTLVLLALTGLHYVRTQLTRRAQIVLGAIRVLIVATICLAFLQPTVRFRRLIQGTAPLAVLVDQSKSMQLFPSDSISAMLHDAIRAHELPGREQSSWFCFGDTLRPCRSPRDMVFDDDRSYFPRFFDRSRLSETQRIVVVSDGNWSNATVPQSLLEARECYYLELPAPEHRPYLDIKVLTPHLDTPRQDTATVRALVSGFSSDNGHLSIHCRERGSTLARTRWPVDSGFFSDTVSLRVRARAAGRHLYKLVLYSTPDSLDAAGSIVHNVVPDRFLVHSYAARSRLDRRFLELALRRDSLWEVTGPVVQPEKADLLILYDWDQTAATLLKRLKRSGVVLFAGSAPCSNPDTIAVAQYAIQPGDQLEPSLTQLIPPAPPPLSNLITCRQGTVKAMDTVLALIPAPVEKRRPRRIPFLTQGSYRRHAAVTIATRDFWKLTFWPRAFGDGDGSGESMAAIVLETVRGRLLANLSERLLAYPQRLPVHAAETIPFTIALPAGLDVLTDARLSISIASPRMGTVYDTLLSRVFPSTNLESLSLPPLPDGRYEYTCTLAQGKSRYRFADSLHVKADNTEYQIMGQNTALLSQFARPLQAADSLALQRILGTSPAADDRRTVTTVLRFEQTWYVLALILALFAVEWAIRRRLQLDG